MNKEEEIWKQFNPGYNAKLNYAVSNLGRIKSYQSDIESGRILKGGCSDDYPTFRYKVFFAGQATEHHILVRKLVADAFLIKLSEKHKYVISLDHNRKNNRYDNLMFVTKEERDAHRAKSPYFLESINKLRGVSKNGKEKDNIWWIRSAFKIR